MAYTRTWDAAYYGAPAGGAQVSGGDDAIRDTRFDMKQRMDTLVNDWNADPLTIKATALGVLGQITGRKLSFGPHTFDAVNDNDDTDHQSGYLGMNTTGLTFNGTLYLPHGISIMKLEASMDKGLAATCSLELFKINLTSGAKTVLDTAVRSVAGVGITAGAIANPPGILEVTDSATYVYGARFFADAWVITGPKFYGITLTVDIPSIAAYV